MSLARVLLFALLPLLASGCLAAASQLYALADDQDDEAATEAVELEQEPAPAAATDEVSPDAVALAEALLPTPEPAASVIEPTPVGPAELELTELEIEWVDRTGGYYGYYGYGGATDPAKMLRVTGRAKLGVAAGDKAEVVIKARCHDGDDVATDADVSTIDDSFVIHMPAPGTEFRIGVKLFVASAPPEPRSCRVTAMLRDPSRTPVRRGLVERCWDTAAKRAHECAPDAGPPPASPAQTWSVADTQFLPTGELGFAVVAGAARAPDRLGVRATCHIGDKQFVEFKYLTGRWYSLEPGESLRVREQLQSSWEFMRYTDCDIEVHDVGYDFDKQSIRGMKAISKLCSRPIGLRAGGCRSTAPEAPTPDPSGMPAKLEVQTGAANAYGGWYNAYVMGELTMLSVVPAGATVEFVAHCGKRTEKQPVPLQTGLELVYPGQSVRAQGNVSFTGKVKIAGCTTKMVLSAKDAAGTPVSWTLATQCYDKHGSYTPCPGAPAPTAPTGLGLSGIGAGGIHKRSIGGK